MKNNNYGLFSLYYNLLFKDKNYEDEAEYVYQKLKIYQPDLSKILELGTGTGIHADLLQKKGLHVTGIDLSEDMAQQAREKGIECYVSDCSDFSLKDKFDAAISLFHVIGYVTENENLIKTFHNVYNHLKPGGVFLFDLWYSPAVYNLKPETRIKRMENDEVKIIRLAEPVVHSNKNIVDINYDLIIEEKSNGKFTRFAETHPIRHFSLPEIQLLASMTGFQIVESLEWMTGEQPSDKTWGVCFILKRN